MKNTIEIELRYEVLDLTQVTDFLSCAKQLHKRRDVDLYFDTPDRILWKRGIFIRTRNNKKLEIKFNRECLQDLTIDRLDYCEEHSFALPLEESRLQELNLLLASLDLKTIACADFEILRSVNALDVHYAIDKVRTSYAYNSFTIAVDEVAGLGTFLEIELMAKDVDDLENVKHDMQLAIAGLRLQPIGAGYGSLILKKNDFECYIQGRYALKTDKLEAAN